MFKTSNVVFASPVWRFALFLFVALVGAATPGMAASATLVKTDTTASGSWKGVYGLDGARIATSAADALNPSTVPGYATVNVIGAATFEWQNPAVGVNVSKSLQKTGATTDRIGSAFFHDTTFDIDVNLTDGQTHKVALYALDWEGTPPGRKQTIQVLEFGTNTPLSNTSQENFKTGVYSVWDVQGHVIFRITKSAGGNSQSAVISGIFFGADLSNPVSIVSPLPGNVGDDVTLTAAVSSSVTVASVQFKLDGVNINSPITTGGPNYTTTWNSFTASTGAHTLTAEVTDNLSRKFTSDPVSINVVNVPQGNSATFVKTDNRNPAGNWKGVYGIDGYVIAGESSLPSYATVVGTKASGGAPVVYRYTDTPIDADYPYAMQWAGTPPSSITQDGFTIVNPARNPSIFYDPFSTSGERMTYDITFNDGKRHQVAVYALDFDGGSRSGTFTILDGDTNIPIPGATQTVQNFAKTSAKYYVWTMSGHVKIQMDNTKPEPSNFTFSGIFFGGGAPPPTISITSPPAGPVSGTVALSANATSASGNPPSVQFRVDGVNFGQPILAPPYTIQWPSNTASGGSHTLGAVATDGAGQTSSASVIVSVIPPAPPTISFTNPAPGASVTGTPTISVNATAGIGTITSVQFFADDQPLGAAIVSPPYSMVWNTNPVSLGSHTLKATVTNSGGGTATAAVNVTVQRVPPNVTMTGPAGPKMSGAITVTANATPTQAPIQSVQFTIASFGNVFLLNAPVPGSGPNFSTIYDSSGLPNGYPYEFRAEATDTLGQKGVSAPLTLTSDNPPPAVSLSAPTGTQQGTITLTATATSPKGKMASVQLKVDGVAVGALITGAGPTFAIPFNTGAVANGPHTITAVAADVAAQTTESAAVAIVISNPPPTVTLTNPTAGGSVAGTVNLQATVNSPVGIYDVAFAVDSVLVGSVIPGHSGSTYTYAWPSGTVSNGPHYVFAFAHDLQGQLTYGAFVSITVANAPPTVSMTAPATGSTLLGTVNLSATASSATAQIASVQFKVDGNIVGTAIPGANNTYTFSWNTGSVGNSSHSITAFATDSGGLTATSAGVSVIVNNPPPTVSILTPTGAFSLLNTVNITANAASAAGIASVQFQLDGNNLDEPVLGAGPNFSKAWDTKSTTNAAHVLRAIAKDTQGQTTTSAPVNVTVSNGTAPPPKATFLTLDTDTKGDWKTKYGNDGYVIAGDTTLLPVYITATPQPPLVPTNGLLFTYSAPLQQRHLLKSASSERIAAAYYTGAAFTYDVDFTDGQVHQLSLYSYDQEGNTRNQTISILNANTNAVLNEQTLTNFNGGVYTRWNIQGHIKIQVKKNSGDLSAVVSGIFFDTELPPPPPPTISVVPIPPTVAGNVDLIANASSSVGIKNIQFKLDGLSLGAPLTGAGPLYTFTWDTTTTINGNHTIVAVATDTVNQTTTTPVVNVTTNNPLVPPKVTMTAPASGNVAATVTVSATASSVAGISSVQFLLDGANLGAIQNGSGPNFSIQWNTIQASQGSHTLSAKAKDTLGQEATSPILNVTVLNPVPSASFVKIDPDTKGDWKGNYGADGWIIPKDTNNTIPAYATVVLPGAAGPSWEWVTASGPSALQKGANNSTARIGSAFYTANSANPFTFDINITDANTHELALYVWDLEASGRTESITILNANTNAVLATQSVSNFGIGKYVVFNITGHVLVRVAWTGGGINAVLNGLFFKTLPPPPAISITTPTPSSSLTGMATLTATATATAPATVSSVQFLLDGAVITPQISGSGSTFTTQWDSSTVLNGSHTLTAVATDSSSQTRTSNPVTVSTTNTPGPPNVIFTNPASGSTVSGTVNVTANAVSAAGIASVQFKVDGVNAGAPKTNVQPNYSFQWNTTTLSNGNHTLKAVAVDKNSVPLSAEATVSVTVQNILPSARFMKYDTDTQGDWKGTYGADGYIIPNDSNFPPNYVTVTGPDANGAVYQYVATTSKSGLLKGSSLTERATAVFYSVQNASSFSFDMNFTDPNEHELALYMWDRDSNTRVETITILNGDTNTMLVSKPVSNFGSGTYAVFNVKGHVIVRVQRTAGSNAVISGLFFKTPPPLPAPPAVTITSPSDVSSQTITLSQTVTLTANAVATSPATLASLQFNVDGSPIGVPITAGGPTYTMQWNSKLVTNGQHTLTAVATDSLGQSTTSPGVVFTANNPDGPPAVTLTAPAAGPVNGVVTLSATAASVKGIANVQFKLDGNNLGSPQVGSGPNYSISWDTTGITGPHILSAVATDINTPVARTGVAPDVAVTVVNPTTTGAFVKTDSTTLGEWRGTYGADGYIIPNTPNNLTILPSYLTVTGPGTNGATWVWPANTFGDPKALFKGYTDTQRITSAFYSGTSMTFDMNFTDVNIHEVAFYMWDLDGGANPRGETISILNANTNDLLATKAMTAFSGSAYAVFNVSGHILVKVTKTSGSNAIIGGIFFKTLPPNPPPPAVSIANPASGAVLTGKTVALNATATANGTATMASVQFLVDGSAIGAPVSGTGPSFSTTWNSTGVANGPHTVAAIATDSLGQSNTSVAVNVTTNNVIGDPVITITNPAPGPVSGTVTVTANATSPAGIASVQFKLNGSNLGAPQAGNGPNYSISWNTAGLAGAKTLTAVAIDKSASPRSGTSDPVNVTILDNGASAAFVKFDTETKGDWKTNNAYGADGYIIPNDPYVVPSYVTVTGPAPAGAVFQYTPTTSPSALLKGSSQTTRSSAVFYNPTAANPYTFDMNFTDGQLHELALYMWDLEPLNRVQTITILNGETNGVLLTKQVSNFTAGVYAVFNVRGHVLVRISLNSGQSAVVSGLFFETPPPPPPPPAVSITTPGPNTPLTGLATLTANATANAPSTMKSVQFRLDGNPIGAPLLGVGPSYTMPWDSRGSLNGSHTLTAVATDSIDQVSESAGVPISTNNIDNGPVITMTAPAPGQVTGVVTVTASATSPTGISSVQFKLDGNNLGAPQSGGGPNYSISWDTSGLTGTHFLSAVAIDTNLPAKTNESTHLTVTVANSSPKGTFIKTDSQTKGNWKGTYGANGYIIPSSSTNPPPAISLPADMTVTPTGGTQYSWPSNTWNDERALRQANSDTLRIASTFYSGTSMTFDVNFTDVNLHELALYMWDLDGGVPGRGETISILDANTNAILATQPMANLSGGVYAVFNIGGHVVVKVTRTSGSNAIIGGLFLKTLEAPPPPPPPPSVIITSPLSGAAITGTTNLTATAIANSPSTMVSVQFRLDGSSIGAPVLGPGPTFTMPWNSGTATNGSHTLTAVAVDSASQTALSPGVSISTSNTVVAPTVSITSPLPGPVSGIVNLTASAGSTVGIASVQFKLDGNNLGAPITGGPIYTLQWDTRSLNGQHTLTAVAKDLQPVPQSTESNPVIVTIAAPTNSAIFVKSDTEKQGNWKGNYGADGFIIPNDISISPDPLSTRPTYALVTFTGATPYTWSGASGDGRALQKGSNNIAGRISSAYYSNANTFSVDVNMSDGQLHQMALYFADMDTTTRKETVQILDAETNNVLQTQQLPSFSNGVYLVYNVRGHILVKVTNAGGQPNILLNGMFFRSFTGLTPPAVDITSPTGGTLPRVQTIVANATSGQGIASIQLQLNGVNLGGPLTGPGPNYSKQWATPGVPDGTYTLTAIAMDSLGLTSTSPGYTVTIANGAPVIPAFFSVTKDTATSGSWVGKYGSDGYLISPGFNPPGDKGVSVGSVLAGSLTVPYYVNLDLNGATTFTWKGQDVTPNQLPGLQKSPTDLEHYGTTYEVRYLNNVPQAMVVDLNFIDNQTHRVAFYFLDWHHTDRIQTVEVLDANTDAVLSSQPLSPVGFDGTYLVYKLQGHVKLRVLQTNVGSGLSTVLSGMFFDPAQ